MSSISPAFSASFSLNLQTKQVAIIGAGPAGLMAAEVLAQAGCRVKVYDAMPSVGRKLLQAGKGGFNLTHSEPYANFISRYGDRQAEVVTWLEGFNADDLRQWAADLGIETFVGSSGRIYPSTMQAAPLVRRWLHRLRQQGVQFAMRHRCLGWDAKSGLLVQKEDAIETIYPNATLLALGGASWPRLGSNGDWQNWFADQGIEVNPFLPANSGFNVAWSEVFAEKFAGQPLKNCVLSFQDASGNLHSKLGEAMITVNGLEGSLVYALSAKIRDTLLALHRPLTVWVDLMPDQDLDSLCQKLQRAKTKLGKQSLASFFKRQGLSPLQVGLLREALSAEDLKDMTRVANCLKHLPIQIQSPRPLAEAISTAGGVAFSELTSHLMLKQKPGVFCAGEMLDWEAPTGGYLLTAVMASGKVAAEGILDYFAQSKN